MSSDLGERAGTPEGLAKQAEVILDPRLAEIWQMLWALRDEAPDEEGFSEDTVAALLRLAYVQGYVDATGEWTDGTLYRRLGLRIPAATPTTGAGLRARPRRGSSDR